MQTKLLTFEVVLSGGAALGLLLFPNAVTRLFGWTPSPASLWPRIAGATLAGLAVATTATLAGWSRTALEGGLGLAGHASINFVIGFVLLSMAVVGPDMPTRRGRWVAVVLAMTLIVLALIEIAHL